MCLKIVRLHLNFLFKGFQSVFGKSHFYPWTFSKITKLLLTGQPDLLPIEQTSVVLKITITCNHFPEPLNSAFNPVWCRKPSEIGIPFYLNPSNPNSELYYYMVYINWISWPLSHNYILFWEIIIYFIYKCNFKPLVYIILRNH